MFHIINPSLLMGVLYAKTIISLTCDTSIFLVEEVKYQAETLKLWSFTAVAICCGQRFNHPVTEIVIPSLILRCSPLKINGWKMYFLFGAPAYFQRRTVSFQGVVPYLESLPNKQ